MLTEGETAIKFDKFPIKDVGKVGSINWYLFKQFEKWRVDTAKKLQNPVDADTLHKWNRADVTKTNIKRFHELEKKYPWLTFELFVFLLGYEYRSKELLEALKP